MPDYTQQQHTTTSSLNDANSMPLTTPPADRLAGFTPELVGRKSTLTVHHEHQAEDEGATGHPGRHSPTRLRRAISETPPSARRSPSRSSLLRTSSVPMAERLAEPRFVAKTGHCRKEGGFVKSWRRRSFLLDDRSLRYYVPSKFCQPQGQTEPLAGANLKGTIPLHSMTAVMAVGGELHVATKGGRTYKLRPEPCAEDPIGNAVGCWAAALQHNITAHAAALRIRNAVGRSVHAIPGGDQKDSNVWALWHSRMALKAMHQRFSAKRDGQWFRRDGEAGPITTAAAG